MTTDTGTLYYGDCLDVLRELPPGVADLVYLDPPFNSARNYNAFLAQAGEAGADAQITAFKDTWQWGPQAQREHDGILRHPDAGGVADLLVAFCNALGPCPMAAYIVMMTARLLELRRVLKPTGSLWLHCDPTASHYLKIMLDGIFGQKNFRNEVSWKRSSAHNDARQGRKQMGNVRDILLFYSKGDTWTWNTIFTPYSESLILKNYRHIDADGRRYSLGDLTAAKGGGDTSYEFHGTYPYKGRFWAYSRENMEKFLQEGLIHFPGNGKTPLFKRYLDTMPGVSLQNDWQDIPPVAGKERLGYPTQKPVALLERILTLATSRGDLVVDPFCGCGTTVHAAQKLGRRWIGIDITHLAVNLISQRIRSAFPKASFSVEGTPRDVASARYLAESNGLEGRYQFQYWALSLIGALPTQGRKKGADGGADGQIWAYDSPTAKKPFKIVVSVKSGKIPANHIRELEGMIGRGDTKMAILITLEEPGRVMLADAVRAGDHVYPGGQACPRIQILTIAGLLDGTERPRYLDYREGAAMNRQARRESRESPRGRLFDTDDGDGGGAGQGER